MQLDILDLSTKFGKGLVTTVAPSVMKAALLSLFRDWNMDIKVMVEWVGENKCLWDVMGEEHQAQVKQLASKIGPTNWLNGDWAISAIKKDYPVIASMFLSDKKAKNWLERELAVIKTHTQQPAS